MTEFLIDGPAAAEAALLLAHGAGAPMDSPFMSAAAANLGAAGIRVLRFEFAYMAARRVDGKKRPPPKAEKLMEDYRTAVEEARGAVADGAGLFIGGKSLGGRVASLVAGEAFAGGLIRGLVCLGYPFHPPGRPEKLRTAHLEALKAPALVCQGERDPFGTREEVIAYALSSSIRFVWLTDGDHDLKPRKASGLTKEQNWQAAAEAVAAFVRAA